MGQICIRSLLTMLHGLIGLAAGFFCLYTLFSSNTPTNWLPQLVDGSGGWIPFKNGLPTVTDSLVFGMGAICLLNFLMCIVNNCLFKNTCVIVYHLMLTSVFLAFSVFGAAIVTVYYLVWCDVLQQTVTGSTGCGDAAVKYDSFNSTAQMSSHKSQMEVQMAIIWTLLPLTCFALLTYSITLPFINTLVTTDNQIQYVIVQDERTPLLTPRNTPLLTPENRLTNVASDSRRDDNQPSTSSESNIQLSN